MSTTLPLPISTRPTFGEVMFDNHALAGSLARTLQIPLPLGIDVLHYAALAIQLRVIRPEEVDQVIAEAQAAASGGCPQCHFGRLLFERIAGRHIPRRLNADSLLS